jgi:hypothetical protein
LGLDHPVVTTALVAHGFTEQDRLEGHRLLSNLATLAVKPAPERTDLELIARFDAFENKWFPIVKASLGRHFPELAQHVFYKLRQTEGLEVVLGVMTLLERVEQLERGDGVYAKDGPAARALLATRGFTAQVVAETRALLASIGEMESVPPAPVEPDARKVAEDALWAWYLEWSAIVRSSVTDRSALRRLGFLKKSRRGADETSESEGA